MSASGAASAAYIKYENSTLTKVLGVRLDGDSAGAAPAVHLQALAEVRPLPLPCCRRFVAALLATAPGLWQAGDMTYTKLPYETSNGAVCHSHAIVHPTVLPRLCLLQIAGHCFWITAFVAHG